MTARQAELLPKPPPRRRGHLMHVSDAGGACSGDSPAGSVIVTMRCAKCDHETDWLEFRTVTEAKRGLPCPRCNEQKGPVRCLFR